MWRNNVGFNEKLSSVNIILFIVMSYDLWVMVYLDNFYLYVYCRWGLLNNIDLLIFCDDNIFGDFIWLLKYVLIDLYLLNVLWFKIIKYGVLIIFICYLWFKLKKIILYILIM